MTEKINQKFLLYKLQAKKDPEAFVSLYDYYAPRIYRFVFFKVSNKEEAEDIVSEVFLKAWNYINNKNEVDSFSGLLYKLARNCVIDLYRKKAKEPVSRIEESEAEKTISEANVEEQTADKLEIKKLMAGLNDLKQEYKEMITLRYVDELEIAEIAEITGKGKVAVRVTIHRALKRLKQNLEQ